MSPAMNSLSGLPLHFQASLITIIDCLQKRVKGVKGPVTRTAKEIEASTLIRINDSPELQKYIRLYPGVKYDAATDSYLYQVLAF